MRIAPSIVLDEAHVDERFVRAPGPGGQNVNKVATAVELRVDVAAQPWPGDVKARLRTLAGRRMTAGGVLVIQAHEHRTQAGNRAAARARLAALVRQAAAAPKRRRPTAPSAASRERRLAGKQRRGALKRRRSSSVEDD